MAYNDSNVFAKILRGEIPSTKVYEDDHVYAFEDINPWAPVHVLIVPKGRYEDLQDFNENASDSEIVALQRAIAKIARQLDVVQQGYRVLTNKGENGHQEVPHLHFHLFGGRPLGPMLPRRG